MKYRVYISQAAQDDLFDIYRHILAHDSVQAGDHVVDKIEELCLSLCQSPQRGDIPVELGRISVSNYRQLHFKPYRIIYAIDGDKVYIHCILDGRRDLRDLLERRLLR